MGYDTNIAPPRPWFCGHPYLKEAARLIDSVSTDNPSVRTLAVVIAARLNIMRGIRVAVKLKPEDYKAKDILLKGLKKRIGAERFNQLKSHLHSDFQYSIGGTGQYGVANYDIRDNNNPELSFSLLHPEGQALLPYLIAERLEAVNCLMRDAIDILYWHAYVPEKQYDIHYYDIRDGMGTDEILEMIVEFGFAENETEARSRWGEAVENDERNIDNGGEIDQAFHSWAEERYGEIVNEDFWNWEESEAIYHGFGD